MDCLSGAELKDFVGGRLPAEKMLEATVHVRTCGECGTLLASLTEYRAAVDNIGREVSAFPCPEYEELSAYVSEELSSVDAQALRSHVSACEFCAQDVQAIQTLRSHARLRPEMIVVPGGTRRVPVWRLWWPKLVTAAGAVAVVAAFTLVFFTGPRDEPNTRRHVPNIAQTPSVPSSATIGPSSKQRVAAITTERTNQPAIRNSVVIATGPSDYSRLAVSGDEIARIKRAVDEKLRTGKLTADRPIRVAMANVTDRVRANMGSIGPVPISPVSETVLHGNMVLKWRPIEGAEEYQVELTDAHGKSIASRKTTASHVTILASDVPSEGGVFLWRAAVRLGADDTWESGRAAVVRMLGVNTSRTVQRARSVYSRDHLVLGTLYELNGLYSDAAREFRVLAESPRHPANADAMLASVRAKLR